MPAPPASNNKRKRPLVGTPKTESPSKKKLHGQTYEVLKKTNVVAGNDIGDAEDFDALVSVEASSVLKDDWNGNVLYGSHNTVCASLSQFQFRNFCKPQTRSKVRLSYTCNSLSKNGPVKRALTVYVVSGAHNGSIGLYVASKSNPVAEVATLKVFNSIDCANMSGQYVVLTEPVPSEAIDAFSQKILPQIDYFVEFSSCVRGDTVRIPPCVITTVKEDAVGNTQALGLELLSCFGIETVLYSRDTPTATIDRPRTNKVSKYVSSPSDYNYSSAQEYSRPRLSNYANRKTFFTSPFACQVDMAGVPRYTICVNLDDRVGLHYSYFKDMEQMVWRSLFAGSVILHPVPGMEVERVKPILRKAYEPFSQELAPENNRQAGDCDNKSSECNYYSENALGDSIVEVFVQPGENVQKNQLCAVVHSNHSKPVSIKARFGGIVTAMSTKTKVGYGDFIVCISKHKRDVDTTKMFDVNEEEVCGSKTGFAGLNLPQKDKVGKKAKEVYESCDSDGSEEF